MRDNGLPDGWATATLDQFTQERGRSIDPSRFPSSDFELYSVPSHETGRPERLAAESIGSSKQMVQPGSVLLCKINPRINRTWVVQAQNELLQIASTEWIVFPRHEAFEPNFLSFFLRQNAVRDFLAHNVSGVGGSLMRVKASTLKGYPVPIAPLNEQRRIVEKIETLFARLDKGEEALRDVQKLLVRYRQSVLKAAVTGELTADWRVENAHRLEHGRDLLARILQTRRETWDGRGKYKEPVAPDTTGLPDLPEGWVWASIEQTAIVMGGLTKNKKRQEMPIRKPMLRVANVYQNRLNLHDIHLTGVTEAECSRVLLENLDLLVVEGNGSKDQIGRMAVWRNEVPDAVHQNHLIKVRMVEKGLVEFALWWFQSPNGRQNIEKMASSTSGLYTLSISKIEALVVPVPGLLEIQEINELVDEAFSRISHLEAWCQTELARSAALRQSILKDAFAGRLVPQDPADEPAAALLARIKESRAAAPGKTRRKARA